MFAKNKYTILKSLCLSFFLLFTILGFSQSKNIIIEHSSDSYADEEKYPGATILLGNVIMRHEGAKLTCQKALYYKKQNFFKALGSVIIKQGDTITQTSDYADYDANSKTSIILGKCYS